MKELNLKNQNIKNNNRKIYNSNNLRLRNQLNYFFRGFKLFELFIVIGMIWIPARKYSHSHNFDTDRTDHRGFIVRRVFHIQDDNSSLYPRCFCSQSTRKTEYHQTLSASDDYLKRKWNNTKPMDILNTTAEINETATLLFKTKQLPTCQ